MATTPNFVLAFFYLCLDFVVIIFFKTTTTNIHLGSHYFIKKEQYFFYCLILRSASLSLCWWPFISLSRSRPDNYSSRSFLLIITIENFYLITKVNRRISSNQIKSNQKKHQSRKCFIKYY